MNKLQNIGNSGMKIKTNLTNPIIHENELISCLNNGVSSLFPNKLNEFSTHNVLATLQNKFGANVVLNSKWSLPIEPQKNILFDLNINGNNLKFECSIVDGKLCLQNKKLENQLSDSEFDILECNERSVEILDKEIDDSQEIKQDKYTLYEQKDFLILTMTKSTKEPINNNDITILQSKPNHLTLNDNNPQFNNNIILGTMENGKLKIQNDIKNLENNYDYNAFIAEGAKLVLINSENPSLEVLELNNLKRVYLKDDNGIACFISENLVNTKLDQTEINLGSGAFGSVHTHKNLSKIGTVVKKLSNPLEHSNIKLLNKLKIDTIKYKLNLLLVPLIKRNDKHILPMGGTIFRSEIKINASAVKELCIQVDKLHELGYWHCDIKPDNMMINTDGFIQIIDWDWARSLKICGSRIYMPAQILYSVFQLQDPNVIKVYSTATFKKELDRFALILSLICYYDTNLFNIRKNIITQHYQKKTLGIEIKKLYYERTFQARLNFVLSHFINKIYVKNIINYMIKMECGSIKGNYLHNLRQFIHKQ